MCIKWFQDNLSITINYLVIIEKNNNNKYVQTINKDNKNDKEFDEMVVNNKLPEMIPKIAKELNIPDDQIINQF